MAKLVKRTITEEFIEREDDERDSDEDNETEDEDQAEEHDEPAPVRRRW